MNPALDLLQPYPFEKLAQLKAGLTPAAKSHIALSIGEPKHAPPAFVVKHLIGQLGGLSNYPTTKGLLELRSAMAQWATARFNLQRQPIDPERQILPVAGTREALFSFIQAAAQAGPSAKILMPNPFYQIYEGAALLAGCQPVFLNCTQASSFLPDFDAVSSDTWRDCQVLFICSPGNPTGKIIPLATLQKLIALADEYNFIIASDECYSELYYGQKPPGLLEACASLGRTDYRRCVVFHSLSKRSNLPGLRSGFIAGDAAILQQYLLYRTYQGCALPVPTQLASQLAWQDESHVEANRAAYAEKFATAQAILSPYIELTPPEGAFYYWLKTPINGEQFTRDFFLSQNVTVLPGAYLSRLCDGINPGEDYVRMALVAEITECREACERLRDFLKAG
ncbi:MAG: succinyldiaminopimelate transaminase [Marinagarivorans sp.]